MIVEVEVINALRAGLTLAPPVHNAVAPQPEGDQPAPLPLVIVNRTAAAWSSTFCGTDFDLAITDLQVDFYARSNAAARTLADEARPIIGALDPPPTLQSEITIYDDTARAFRIVQTWRTADYNPRLT